MKKYSLLTAFVLGVFLLTQPVASAETHWEYDWTRLIVSGYGENRDSALGDFSIDGQMVLTADNYRFKGFLCSLAHEEAEEMCTAVFEEYGIEEVSENAEFAGLINEAGEMRVVQILNTNPLTVMFANVTKVFSLVGSSADAPVDRFPLIDEQRTMEEALYELYHHEEEEDHD